MRWPRQQVMKVLSARTPRSSGAPTRRRAWASGGVLRNAIRRRPVQQRSLAVDRLAQRVDYPAQPTCRWPHRAGNRGNKRAASAPHAFERSERHQQRKRPGKSDHFTRNILAGRLDDHPRADRHGMQRSCDFHHQPAHANDAAVDLDAVQFVDLFGQRLHGAPARRLQMVTTKFRVLTLYLPGPLIIASSLGIQRLAKPDWKGESLESVSAET